MSINIETRVCYINKRKNLKSFIERIYLSLEKIHMNQWGLESVTFSLL